MKPTLKDIALAANVSIATVSNSLNNRKGVSESVRQLVFKKAKELGYSRDTNGSRPTIRLVFYKRHGMIVSNLHTPFFSSLTEGLEKQCRAQGYALVISHFTSEAEDQTELRQLLHTDYADGIIVLATEMLASDLVIFAHVRTPVILLDSRFRGSKLDMVLIDNIDAAFSATRHLLEHGHRAIGYLHSSICINNFRDRETGYREAMATFNITPDDRYRLALEPTMEGAYRDMMSKLDQLKDNLPTAFFADNDNIAIGAMRAMQERGIRVPDDVSLVGIDDMPFCEMTNPRLTTIRVFKQEIGVIAVKRLIEKILGDTTVMIIEVDTELIQRESDTGFMPGQTVDHLLR